MVDIWCIKQNNSLLLNHGLFFDTSHLHNRKVLLFLSKLLSKNWRVNLNLLLRIELIFRVPNKRFFFLLFFSVSNLLPHLIIPTSCWLRFFFFSWKETEESMCMSDLVFAYEGDTGSILNRNHLWILWKGILNLFDGEFQAIKMGSELWTGHSRAIWAASKLSGPMLQGRFLYSLWKLNCFQTDQFGN